MVSLDKYDYDSTVARMTALLANESTYLTSRSQLASIQFFIKMYGWTVESLGFQAEAVVRDLKFGTSQSLQALLEHVKLVGYRARKNRSATMTVRFSVEATQPLDVTIPKWSVVEFSGIQFVTISQATLTAGQLYVDVSIVQGERSKQNFTGTGIADAYFDILESTASDEYTQVSVNAVLWTSITDFYAQTAIAQVFLPRNIYGGLRIEFGDGVYGAVPPVASTINVNVLLSAGSQGNLSSSGLTGLVVSTILDQGAQPVDFSVLSLTIASGGLDAESVKEIKRNTPHFITSGGVHKRKVEIENGFLDLAQISQVHVISEFDKPVADQDIRNANKIDVYAVPAPGYLLDRETKLAIIQELLDNDSVLLNVTYNLQEAEYVKVKNVVGVYVDPTVIFANKQSEVDARLLNFYSGFVFGSDFSFYALLQSLSEIDDGVQVPYRDVDIRNLTLEVYVVQELEDLNHFGLAEGFEKDISTDVMVEHGMFRHDETIADLLPNKDGDIWIDHQYEGVLKVFPITEFNVEIDGVLVLTITDPDNTTFSVSGAQGVVDFTTGVYGLSVSDAVSTVSFYYKYYRNDIDMEFNQFPLLESRTVTVYQFVT